MRKREKETLEQIQTQNPAPLAAAPAAAAQTAAAALGHPTVPGDNEDEGKPDPPFPSLGTQETEPGNGNATKSTAMSRDVTIKTNCFYF